jgi:hypothetical protein
MVAAAGGQGRGFLVMVGENSLARPQFSQTNITWRRLVYVLPGAPLCKRMSLIQEGHTGIRTAMVGWIGKFASWHVPPE